MVARKFACWPAPSAHARDITQTAYTAAIENREAAPGISYTIGTALDRVSTLPGLHHPRCKGVQTLPSRLSQPGARAADAWAMRVKSVEARKVMCVSEWMGEGQSWGNRDDVVAVWTVKAAEVVA